MDFLNKGKDMLSKNNEGGSGQQSGTSGQQTGGQSQDYGDKALNFAEKQTGHNMDSNTNEKITDGARGLYEKGSGNKVDPKYSN